MNNFPSAEIMRIRVEQTEANMFSEPEILLMALREAIEEAVAEKQYSVQLKAGLSPYCMKFAEQFLPSYGYTVESIDENGIVLSWK